MDLNTIITILLMQTDYEMPQNGGKNVNSVARKFHIPKSTLHDQWKEFKDT